MLTVKKFCFAFKLETGALFTGWIGIIGSLILSLALMGAFIFAFHDVVEYMHWRFSVRGKAELPVASENTFLAAFSESKHGFV